MTIRIFPDRLYHSYCEIQTHWSDGGKESTGVSRLKAPSGEVKNPGQVAPTTGSLILFPPPPPTPKVFKVSGYCYHYKIC